MPLPHLIDIGAMKCGTTSLHHDSVERLISHRVHAVAAGKERRPLAEAVEHDWYLDRL